MRPPRLLPCPLLLALAYSSSASAAPFEPNPDITLPDADLTSHKVELVDLDADGWVDLLFANSKGEGIAGGPANRESNQFWRNDEGSGFTAVLALFAEEDNAWTIKAGDVDNDGDADLVVGDNFPGGLSYVLLNEGGLTFSREDIPLSAGLSIGDLELGDVDGDGDLDILATDWGPLPHGQIDDTGASLRLWLGNGDGTFSDGSANLMMGMDVMAAWSFDLDWIDFNNDYALDAIVSTRGDADPARVLINDGLGNLTDLAVPSLQPVGAKTINTAFTPMDLTGDGFIDVITLADGPPECLGNPPVCKARDDLQINDTMGQFVDDPATFWTLANNPGKLDFDAATLDFDSDGKPDFVVVGTSDGGSARLFLNDGAALKTAIPAFPALPSLAKPVSLMFADLDRDGREDAVIAQRDPALANQVLFGGTDPMMGVPIDTRPPRIYDDGFSQKLPTALFFGQVAGFMARVDDHKTPTHWHDFLFDLDLETLNLTGAGATLTAHGRRLPYMEFMLGLADPQDIQETPDQSPLKHIVPSIWFGESLWRVLFTVPYNGQSEDTLTWQFCAIDAQANKICVGPFTVELGIDPADCGDGIKEDWEECDDPNDPLCVACKATCGDGLCQPNEAPENCPEDCQEGPDTTGGTTGPMTASSGEAPTTGSDCGDGVCDSQDESFDNCPFDCSPKCGDGVCADPIETVDNCPDDCTSQCGDGVCDPDEDCPQDCDGQCEDSAGDGACEANPPDSCNCDAARTAPPAAWLLALVALVRRRRLGAPRP